MEHSRYWLLSGVVLVLALTGSVRAEPNVVWQTDMLVVGYPEPLGSVLKIHSETVGQLDIAFRGKVEGSYPNPRYSQVLAGEVVVDAEYMDFTEDGIGLDVPARDIYGISRHNGIVRVGMSTGSATEYTRTESGTEIEWSSTIAGSLEFWYSYPSGGYGLDPCTGLGGFIFKNSDANMVYAYETAQDVWATTVLETSLPGSWGWRADMVYTPNGTPVGGYKSQYQDPNGDPNFTCCNELLAGDLDGAGPNALSASDTDFDLDIAVAPDGTIYLLDVYNYSQSVLHVSEDDGLTWTTRGTIPTGIRGAGRSPAIAVAPDESLLAVLLNRDGAPNSDCTLWLSEPNQLDANQPLGQEWWATGPNQLPGIASLTGQHLTFDWAGYLYVVYYSDPDPNDPNAGGLRMVSNMPPWVDNDLDGVHDAVDLCPDSDPNSYSIDRYGCKIPPLCGDQWHPYPPLDINGDCYTSDYELMLMADQWLECTHPLVAGCVQLQPSPEDLEPNVIYMPHWPESSVAININGDLDEAAWTGSDPCWMDLTRWYIPGADPCDIVSAKYALFWGGDASDPCMLIFAAVIVDDRDHVLKPATNWNTSDRIEIYVQGDPNGGDTWGADNPTGNTRFDKAQQYSVGDKGFAGLEWGVFGNGLSIPGVGSPSPAGFKYNVKAVGTMLNYEIQAKAWVWYGGNDPVGPSQARRLEPGMQVGFDIIVGSRYGSLPEADPNYDADYAMLSANMATQKFIFAENFQRWELKNYDGTNVPPECGDWGYLVADIYRDSDCEVGLPDFARLSNEWMDCTDPCAPCGYSP